MQHDIITHILKKLMFSKGLRYNQILQGSKEPSNKVNYYIKKLIKQEVIAKQEDIYYLTQKGKQVCAYRQGATGKITTPPVLVATAFVIKDNKILLQKRKKEPFKDFYGPIDCKITNRELPLEAAQKTLLKETNLQAPLTPRGVVGVKTYSPNKELLYTHLIFITSAQECSGTPFKEVEEGTNEWVNISKLKELQTYPEMLYITKQLKQKEFFYKEFTRIFDGEKFV